MAAEIEHPNVIPVYGVGEDQGLLFIVMRYVPGGVDLGQLMRSGEPFDPARVVRIVSQVAGALDVAHQRGLVHRDVKPGNILIAAHDQVYLTDFGLTKRVSDSQGMTQTGTFVGTVDYIAPEQVEGKPLDGRADQYALGCVAYQLLSGQVPFPRDSDVAKIFAHVNDPTPRLENTPAALADAIQQAMAKDPNQRYRTTGELARALEHAIHGRPPPAPPTLTQQPPPTPTPKQNKRLPLILALIGALLLAGLATGLAIALTGTTHTPNKPTPAPTTPLTPSTSTTSSTSGDSPSVSTVESCLKGAGYTVSATHSTVTGVTQKLQVNTTNSLYFVYFFDTPSDAKSFANGPGPRYDTIGNIVVGPTDQKADQQKVEACAH